MNDILLLFLSLTFSGSILAIILLAIKPFTKSRLSQTWQYYIWLVVILRFLLPFTPQVSVVGEIMQQAQNVINSPVTLEMVTDFDVNDEYAIPQAQYGSQISESPPNVEFEIPSQTKALEWSMYWHDILDTIRLVWLSTALILFVHKVRNYRSFVRFVNAGNKKITDMHILDIYVDELAAAKVKRQLPLYMNNHVTSPMLIGIVRPSLVIPLLEVSDKELRQIFQHELTHYKRLDFLYKWVVQIALCLHWFNPLMSLINKQINKSCELSCDEAVIKHLDEYDRMVYGDALMASLKAQGDYSNFVVSMTMSENINFVKERLDTIMSYKKKSGLAMCATVVLTTVLLYGFTFTGAYAANDKTATGALDSKKEVVNTQDDCKQIVKTLDGKSIQNIHVNVDFCTLALEPASTNVFEVVFTYPEIAQTAYEKHFNLRVEKENSKTIYIATEQDINEMKNTLPEYATLLIKIPQKQYDKVKLNLSAIHNQPIDCNLNATTLEIISKSADISFKIDTVFDNLYIDHYVGDFDLQLQQFSKNMSFDIAISNFTLSLPNDPQNFSLTVHNQNSSVCEFPSSWKQSIRGDVVFYENGNKQNKVNITNKRFVMFTINTGNATASDTVSLASENTLALLQNADNTQETPQVYTDINATQYSKGKHFETIDGENYFSYGRIDIVDRTGYAYQAIVFICNGSDSYVKKFNQELAQLSIAYPNSQNHIAGYLDLIWDNRLRNFGSEDFSAIEKVVATNTNGVQYNAYVVAICGSEDFEKPYLAFYKSVMDVYN